MTTFSTLLYNVHNSHGVQDSLFAKPATHANFAVVIVTEPALRDRAIRQERGWAAYEPDTPLEAATAVGTRARVVVYVNETKVPANLRRVLAVPKRNDAVAVEVSTAAGWVRIVALYCQPGTSTVFGAVRPLLAHARTLLGGDFNTHHVLWESKVQRTTEHDEAAYNLVTECDLELLLPADTVTFPRSSATLDLFFGSTALADRLIRCNVEDEFDCNSDHRPVALELDVTSPATPPELGKWAYDRADWPKAREAALAALATTPEPAYANRADLDAAADSLQSIIDTALRAGVPRVKPPRTPSRNMVDAGRRQRPRQLHQGKARAPGSRRRRPGRGS